MKKNFLLLMLAALLPLAGWAQTGDLSSSKAEIVVSNSQYSTGDAPGIKVIYSGETLNEGTDFVVYSEKDKDGNDVWVYFKDAGCNEKFVADINTQTATLKTQKAGTKLYFKINGKGGFAGSSVIKSFEISKKIVHVQIWGGNTEGKTKVYKAANPEIEKTDVVFTGGDFATGDNETTVVNDPNADEPVALEDQYDKIRITLSTDNVGTQYPTFSGLVAENYDFEYEGKLTITAFDLANAVITNSYGNQQYSGSSIANNVSYTLKTAANGYTLVKGTDYELEFDATSVQDAGTYKVTFNAKGDNVTGTKAPSAASTFVITQAPMSVAIKNAEGQYTGKKFTKADIDVKYNFFGLLGSDMGTELAFTAEPTITIPDNAINVGEYAITLSGGAAKNYTITYINEGAQAGKLNILPRKLDVTPKSPLSKKAGSADPDWTSTATYTITGDQQRVVDWEDPDKKTKPIYEKVFDVYPVLTRDEGEIPGEYVISLKSEGTPTSNYTFGTFDDSKKFTIEKGAVVLTLVNQSKKYGDDDPVDWNNPVEGTDYIVTGMIAGEKLQNVKLQNPNETNFGNYTFSATYTNPGSNYTGVTVVKGTYTIEKRPVTIVPRTQTVNKGAAAAALNQNAYDIVEGSLVDAANLVFKLEYNKSTSIATAYESYADGIKVTQLGTTLAKNYAINEAEAQYGILNVIDNSKTIKVTRNDDALAETLRTKQYKQSGSTYNYTFEPRTLNKEQWYSMVLPFETSVKEISETFGYAIVDVLDVTKNNGDVTLKLWMGDLAANTPFIVKVYEDLDLSSVTFADKEIVWDAAPASTDKSGNQFIGTYSKITQDFGANDYYVSGGNLNNNAKNVTILPTGAYIKAASAASRIFIQEPDGTTTAIEGVVNAEPASVEGWYNLNGVKLNAKPSQKGVYILNGKKVVVK